MTFQEVSFDTETTSVDAISARLVGLSFAVAGGKAWYVAVPRETEAAQRMVDIFRPFYESDTILKVGQNIKYDLTVLGNYGIKLHAPMFDTMLAHYLVQPDCATTWTTWPGLPQLSHDSHRRTHWAEGTQPKEHGRPRPYRHSRLRL